MSKLFSKIYVEITNCCNLACSFCSPITFPKREMSVDEFQMIVWKIKDYTDSIYLHVKGEPLLHSKLDKILTICDENNMKVCLTTNGTLLSKKKSLLFRHSIKQINVSLHSENTFPNYFASVFKACDELSKKTTIVYRIWTLPSLDLTEISTNIVDKVASYYKLSSDVVIKIKKEKNIKIKNNLYLDKDYEWTWPKVNNRQNDTGTCLGTRSHLAILVNGTVVPCCLDSNGMINLGNIFEKNLSDILASSLFQQIRDGFRNRKIVCDLCKSCTYRNRF